MKDNHLERSLIEIMVPAVRAFKVDLTGLKY